MNLADVTYAVACRFVNLATEQRFPVITAIRTQSIPAIEGGTPSFMIQMGTAHFSVEQTVTDDEIASEGSMMVNLIVDRLFDRLRSLEMYHTVNRVPHRGTRGSGHDAIS